MKQGIVKHTLVSPLQQRGAALLILLTLVLLAASYTLLKKLNQVPSDLRRAADTAAVLAEAKAALIGYALKSQARPGELPCPDNSNTGDSAPVCAGNITFRLPWKTLGLPDLRDSDGERLWYAADPAFTGAAILNSDTLATQTVDGGTTRYAAVIIAPGASLQNQSRPPAQQNNILRYLEDDNANNDTVFVSASAGNFNDQLLGITRDELMQAVERRVLKEVSNSLNAYFGVNGYFPNPAPGGTTDCDSGVYAGVVPLNVFVTCNPQVDWGGTEHLPAWFQPNNWNQTIWYVVSTDCVQGASNCGVANLLTVQGTPAPDFNKQALLIAGGTILPSVAPPQVRPATNDNDLLDSGNNRNDDVIFEAIPITTTSNDQIQVVAP